MKYVSFILVFSSLFCSANLLAQNSVTVTIKDSASQEKLTGVTAYIAGTNIAGSSDTNGVVVLKNIPNGKQVVTVSYISYAKQSIALVFPLVSKEITVNLAADGAQLEEVIVESTRSNQTIENIPTRVEVVAEDEVEERSHDKPSDVSHVVREQPGVQVQRTNAVAGTLNIRLQGLNGKYVQLLKDGFPVFGGFSDGIGITQIPPLDLKQVEIIKGPSSTLYGGDAITGVINLISKEPTDKPAYDVMLNGESSRALDAGVFISQKIKEKFGFTLTGTYRYQTAHEWDHKNFSNVPKLNRYSVNPKLFFYPNEKVKIVLGVNYTHQDTKAGAMRAIADIPDSTYNYLQKNVGDHITTQFKFTYDLGKMGRITIKNSENFYQRNLDIPNLVYHFGGTQLASTSEISYNLAKGKHNLVVGTDFRTDKFTEPNDTLQRNYLYLTYGLFAQYSYKITEKTSIEAGFRMDYNNRYKAYPLPHIGALQKWNKVFSTKLNAGMGYKLPTIFQDQSEEVSYVNVLPIARTTKPEISAGGSIDITMKLPEHNGFNFAINQMYFYTHVFRPLLEKDSTIVNSTSLDRTLISYLNSDGYIETRGVETGIKTSYKGFGLTFVYTLTDHTNLDKNVKSLGTLTSKHSVAILAGYEYNGLFSLALDCYYFSPQKLSDGSFGKRIWEMGVNVQISLGPALIFLNLENLLDIRQTNYGPIVYPNPTYSHPAFAEIYGPLEGTLLNAGVKIRLAEIGKKGTSGIERLKSSNP